MVEVLTQGAIQSTGPGDGQSARQGTDSGDGAAVDMVGIESESPVKFGVECVRMRQVQRINEIAVERAGTVESQYQGQSQRPIAVLHEAGVDDAGRSQGALEVGL